MIELNKVHQGDCLEVMKQIEDKSIDLILCDLPYGTTQNNWDSVIDLKSLWEQYNRIIKDNGVIVLTAQTPFDKILGCSNLQMLKYEWIWVKPQGTGHLNAKKMPLKNHENILVFYKKQPTYNPQMVGTEKRIVKRSGLNSKTTNYGKFVEIAQSEYNGRYPLSVQIFNKENSLHPTQKPVELGRYIIRTYTNKGDIVLDNTTGSGSFIISAILEDRHFIGIELEQRYVDICNKRIMEVKSGCDANDDGIPPNK